MSTRPVSPDFSAGKPLYTESEKCHFKLSVTMAVSAVTILVLGILTGLVVAGILPNSLTMLSLFSSGLLISGIVFLACLKMKISPKFNKSLQDLDDAKEQQRLGTQRVVDLLNQHAVKKATS